MTFPIPESLQKYYGNQAIRNAVDELVALNGTGMLDSFWEEARNYNQAVLMAAQVRADLVDPLFRVWEATFGQANPARLGEDCINYENASPATIWNERYVERFYYRDDRPKDEGGRCDDLFVWLVPPTMRTIALGVMRYSEDDSLVKLHANAAESLGGWHVAMEVNNDYNYFANRSVHMAQFLDDPCPALEGFRHDACEMVNFLLQN